MNDRMDVQDSGMVRVVNPEDGDTSIKAYDVGQRLIETSGLGTVDEVELERVIVSEAGSPEYEIYGKMCLRMVGLFLMRKNYCGYFGRVVDDMVDCSIERLIRYGSKYNKGRSRGKNPAMSYCWMLIDQGFKKMIKRRNKRCEAVRKGAGSARTETYPDYGTEAEDEFE